MAKTIELIFDFVSPNAYLIWQPLKDVAERCGAQIEITPAYLGGMHKLTGNAPPMIRDAEVKGKVAYAALEFQRFIDRHGLTRFKMHPALPFNSILLQRVLVAAADETQRQALVEALLPAVWERNVDCSDPQAVGQELAAAGFDAQALLAATQDPQVKAKLAQNTESAVERGAFGIPTFYVDGEMWFGKERLGQIEDYLGGGKP